MSAKQHGRTLGLIAAAVSVCGTAWSQTAEPGLPDVAPPAQPATMSSAGMQPAGTPAPTIPMAEDARADVVEHTWPNRPMLVTGLVVLGGTYGASVIVGAISDREADERLFLPVVGPWLDLKDRDCDVNACDNETLNKTLIIGSGALQGIGALTLVLSLVIPESKDKPWYLIGDEKLTVAPRLAGNETGLTAFGRF